MAKIGLVTDSTAYIPEDLLKGIDLRIVPSLVIWGTEEMRDGFDIQPAEFYQRLAGADEMPTTSQPPPNAFKATFDELIAEGHKEILAVMLSRELSKTIDSAEAAAEQVKEEHPDVKFEIVDSRLASMGTGWPLLEAAKAIEAGKSLGESADIAREAAANSGVLLLVDTLEFLHRGGRIGGAARFLGTALNLKPILEVQNGRVEPLERVRTRGKARSRLVEVAGERVGGRKPLRLAVLHADAREDAETLMEIAKQELNPIQTVITDVSPAVGTHTGPGTLGICYMAGID